MAKKAILLIPLTYNDGSRIPPDVLEGIYEELFVLSGGHTSAGTVQGAYRMKDGSKQTDILEQVWVVYEEPDKPVLREAVARPNPVRRATWAILRPQSQCSRKWQSRRRE